MVKQTSRLVKRTIKQSVLLVLSPKHPKAREGATNGMMTPRARESKWSDWRLRTSAGAL